MTKQEKLIQKNQVLINKLRDKDLDFNDLFILECFAYKEDKQFFNLFTIPSMKDFNLSTRYQFLKKNEYLVENPNNTDEFMLSVKGEDLLFELNSPEVTSQDGTTTAKVVIVNYGKTPDECFDEWWKIYPSNTSWQTADKTTKFTGGRVLKNIPKAKAKKMYLKLLNQGLNHDELVGSLKYEIKMKKLESIKKNINQMDYFKGMESYLNQERYLLFLDNYKNNPDFVKDETGGVNVKSKTVNVKDI